MYIETTHTADSTPTVLHDFARGVVRNSGGLTNKEVTK